jgi:hypothetical protein
MGRKSKKRTKGGERRSGIPRIGTKRQMPPPAMALVMVQVLQALVLQALVWTV